MRAIPGSAAHMSWMRASASATSGAVTVSAGRVSPVTPSCTASPAPPASVVTTGTPENCASISTLGSPSKRDSSRNALNCVSQ
ncbi:Uncharacterised protein [Bordetella pertussis]|nr:Uncharacterised protein [Bordetella pertussis]